MPRKTSEEKVQERIWEITAEYRAARKSEPEDVVVGHIIRMLAETEQAWEEAEGT